MCVMYMWVPWRSEEGVAAPGAGVRGAHDLCVEP